MNSKNRIKNENIAVQRGFTGLFVAHVCVAVLSISCVSYRTLGPESIDRHSGIKHPLAPGDRIGVTMKSGILFEHVLVTAINSEKIEVLQDMKLNGKRTRFKTSITVPDIKFVKRKEINAGKTVLLILAVPVVVIGIPFSVWALEGSPLK
jgi:hypothetical protein